MKTAYMHECRGPKNRPQWHYTSLVKLGSILREGRIRTSPWRRDGRLIVRAAWTSAAAIWEPTATATNVITDKWEFAVDELIAGEMPSIARIGVATDGLLDWAEYLALAGVADAHIWHLAESGYECGSDPENWAVSPGAIPAADWLGVEVWDGNSWIPFATSDNPEAAPCTMLAPAQYLENSRGAQAHSSSIKHRSDP